MKKEEKIKRKDYTWKRKTEQMQDKDMKSSVIFVKEKQRHAFKQIRSDNLFKKTKCYRIIANQLMYSKVKIIL